MADKTKTTLMTGYGDKNPDTINTIISYIAVPEKAQEMYRSLVKQINAMQGEFNGYMAAVRDMLEVPKDWIFNPNLMQFVPPEKPDKPQVKA